MNGAPSWALPITDKRYAAHTAQRSNLLCAVRPGRGDVAFRIRDIWHTLYVSCSYILTTREDNSMSIKPSNAPRTLQVVIRDPRSAFGRTSV